MNLIIISGPPASGKSYVAEALARELKYDHLSKDAYKEKLYDSEAKDIWQRAWYERKARKRFFEELNRLLDKDQSMIIESNFTAGSKKRLKRLLPETCRVIEVYCTARGTMLFKRFIQRNESGKRHHGHHDRQWYALMALLAVSTGLGIRWPFKPLRLSKQIIELDTTNPDLIDLNKLKMTIQKHKGFDTALLARLEPTQ